MKYLSALVKFFLTLMPAQPVAVFDSGRAALNIPFEVDQTNKAYIRGRVNGSGDWRILLDTGVATMFVLDRPHAERLNLKSTEGYQVQGSGASRSAAALAKDLTVRLAGVSLLHIDGIVISQYQADSGKERDAILGFDFFKNFIIIMDYRNKLMNVYDTRAYKREATTEIIPVKVVNNLPYVNARLRFPSTEPIEAQFHLDSGSGTAANLYFRFVNENRLLEKLPSPMLGSTIGEGGEVKTAFVVASSIEISSIKLSSPLVGLEMELGGSLSTDMAAGWLGAPIFTGSRVIFDFPHSRVLWEE